jgi:DNA-binding NarL/FixJ family response regulator
VLRLLVSGKTNEAIGKEIGVSVTRVKFHIRSLFTRFGVEDRASLVREASAAGLIR